MFSILKEDNRDIEEIIQGLDIKVKELKHKNLLNKNDEIYNRIEKMYSKISNWMLRYNLNNKNMSIKDEQLMIDNILDVIFLINEIIKNDL